MTIPERLRTDEARFIIMWGKKGSEGWTTNANYHWSNNKLQEHIGKGGNYGLLCGAGNYLVVDFDDVKTMNKYYPLLPSSFTVETGSGKKHVYFKCDTPISKRIKNKEGKSLIDIQGNKTAVLCPGSKHPDTNKEYKVIKNTDVVPIEYHELLELFSELIVNEDLESSTKKQRITYKDEITERIKELEKISNTLSDMGIPTNKNPTECPFHASKRGQCLSFDDEKGLWHCFHCLEGGDIFNLYMKKENWSFIETKKYLMEKHNLFEAKEEPEKKRNIDWRKLALELHKINPYFFDKGQNFWAWAHQRKAYELVDKIDMMNMFDAAFNMPGTSSIRTQATILESLRRIGRLKIPKDMPPTWVQFKDKVVDISTGEELLPSPEYFAANPIPWKYVVGKETPRINELLIEWVGEEYALSLKEIMAFAMIPNYFIHRMFCFIGQGTNGKSSLTKLISTFLGEDNCSSVDFHFLITDRFATAQKLYKKLTCLITETDFDDVKKTAKFKSIVGDKDKMSFEYKHKTSFDGYNYAKPIITTNHLPQTYDQSDGFFRRWFIIDFPNKFPEDIDPLLTIPEEEYENLTGELVEIGKRLWVERRFTNEGTVEQRKENYEKHSNPLKTFIDTRLKKDINEFIVKREFFELFEKYCEEKQIPKWTEKTVGSVMRKLEYETDRKYINGELHRVFTGIYVERKDEKIADTNILDFEKDVNG
ncbi:bifunctional DNA primase/polymerase [Candidatus Woesearchaeota archaeon]|nr:bifunctional DNA primase/polymerase [Candidatus Woesearchaeota archaeon]